MTCGGLGIYFDRPAAGRLVASPAERSAVVGAACYGQQTDTMWICFGGTNSDCTGCGCTQEHAPVDVDQGYAAKAVTCNASPICTYPFRRGSCSGL